MDLMPSRRGIGKNLPSMPESAAPRLDPMLASLAEEPVDGDVYPAGGAVAALVAALAASLTSAAADRSRAGWAEAGGVRSQAQALRRRATVLAQRDADAYAAARKALAERAGDFELGTAVREAAGPPLELAASAADIAALACAVAEHGAGDVRADAVVAACLAAAAAGAAEHLVRINLVVGGDEQLAARARAFAQAAGRSAATAAEIGA